MASKYNSVQDQNLTTSIGGAPAATDDVYIDKWALTYTAGTDLSAVSLASFTNQPESQCVFSGPGELTLKATTGIVTNAGRGERFELRSNSPATVVQTVVLKPQSPACVHQLKQVQVSTLVCVSGTTIVTDTVNMAAGLVFGGTVWVMPDATATYPITGSLSVWGGSVRLGRDLPDLTVHGGSVEINDTAVSPANVTVNGGTLRLSACGNIGTLNGNAGTLDWTGLSRAVTIAVANWRPGLTILKSRQGVEPAVTTENAPYGRPRVVYVD